MKEILAISCRFVSCSAFKAWLRNSQGLANSQRCLWLQHTIVALWHANEEFRKCCKVFKRLLMKLPGCCHKTMNGVSYSHLHGLCPYGILLYYVLGYTSHTCKDMWRGVFWETGNINEFCKRSLLTKNWQLWPSGSCCKHSTSEAWIIFLCTVYTIYWKLSTGLVFLWPVKKPGVPSCHWLHEGKLGSERCLGSHWSLMPLCW